MADPYKPQQAGLIEFVKELDSTRGVFIVYLEHYLVRFGQHDSTTSDHQSNPVYFELSRDGQLKCRPIHQRSP